MIHGKGPRVHDSPIDAGPRIDHATPKLQGSCSLHHHHAGLRDGPRLATCRSRITDADTCAAGVTSDRSVPASTVQGSASTVHADVDVDVVCTADAGPQVGIEISAGQALHRPCRLQTHRRCRRVLVRTQATMHNSIVAEGARSSWLRTP